MIAVSNAHSSAHVQTLNGSCLEQVCVSVNVHGTRIFICGVYIPPDRSQDVTVINEHISSVSELDCRRSSGDILLVCGDFNQPRILWTNGPDELGHDRSGQLSLASAALIDGMNLLNLYQKNNRLNHLVRVLLNNFYQWKSLLPRCCPSIYTTRLYRSRCLLLVIAHDSFCFE